MKPLPKEDLDTHCKIGQGAECCIWLMCGANGFECHYEDRHQSVLNNWKTMTAQRDGCAREIQNETDKRTS